MSNSDRLNELLSEGGDRLVGRLAKLPDPAERVNLAVQAILSRPPDDEEAIALREFLTNDNGKPADRCRQLVWALLTSAEFRFNY